MAIDIVCGRKVSEGTALKAMYGDRPYYFCSKSCEMNFVGDPMKFSDKSKAASSNEGEGGSVKNETKPS